MVAWLAEEHALTPEETTVGRALKALDYRKRRPVRAIARKTNTRQRI